jgi:ABC-2 type transport system permease protein
MNGAGFSFSRWFAIIVKEFIQLKRDRLTFGMVVGIPVIQLVLFGYVINADPKHLPAAVLSADSSPYARSVVRTLENSGYFEVVRVLRSEAEGEELLRLGKVQFVVTIPADFSRRIVRGESGPLLVEADATDPGATSNALAALSLLAGNALARDLKGALGDAAQPPVQPPVRIDLRVHRRYNPEGITAYNIVPGLLGTILTMTLVLMTGLAVTRERERGTFENLLATPALPIEVMSGKVVPYILIGLIQVTLIYLFGRWLFEVPMRGSIAVLYLAMLLFIVANLVLGITFSTIARNQLQAMQMMIFYFMPSILLSGFMFPYRGMPEWAQWLGNVLPLTHFLILIRGIMLKGTGLADGWPQIWPILLFTAVVMLVGMARYRRTLD